jgi:acetyl esterase
MKNFIRKKRNPLRLTLAAFCCVFPGLFGITAAAQTTEKVFSQVKETSFLTSELVYKKIDSNNLGLRLYYPSSADKVHPAILFFFGGGWVNGTPGQFEQQAKYFAKRGLISVLVDYRTQSKNHTTPFEAVRDAKSAIRYLRLNAAKLHIDPAKIIASGGSAGGQLAAAADLTHLDEPNEDTTISSRPDALVLFNPVFDNSPQGYGYEKIGQNYLEISPLHRIRKGASPAIVFLGTKDKHIPVKTAELYRQKMEAAGSRCDLFLYRDQEHGFFNYRPKTDNKFFFITLHEADAFLSSLGFIKPLNGD